jgi:hypothetical protein
MYMFICNNIFEIVSCCVIFFVLFLFPDIAHIILCFNKWKSNT